jgi:sec-independent protein translocase protein TatA
MHLLVILIIAMFVFGPKKLPELGKGLGEGIRGFKKAMSEVETVVRSETSTPGSQSSRTSSASPAEAAVPATNADVEAIRLFSLLLLWRGDRIS